MPSNCWAGKRYREPSQIDDSLNRKSVPRITRVGSGSEPGMAARIKEPKLANFARAPWAPSRRRCLAKRTRRRCDHENAPKAPNFTWPSSPRSGRLGKISPSCERIGWRRRPKVAKFARTSWPSWPPWPIRAALSADFRAECRTSVARRRNFPRLWWIPRAEIQNAKCKTAKCKMVDPHFYFCILSFAFCIPPFARQSLAERNLGGGPELRWSPSASCQLPAAWGAICCPPDARRVK